MLIDREAAANNLKMWLLANNMKTITPDDVLYYLAHVVDVVEAIEVRHGEWVIDEFGHKCSVCKEYITEEQFKYGDKIYCPTCGSRMDGRRESEGT